MRLKLAIPTATRPADPPIGTVHTYRDSGDEIRRDVWVQCPECKQPRWVRHTGVNYNKTFSTGKCQSCMGKHHSNQCKKAKEGDRATDKNGYVRIFTEGKWAHEHRSIMSRYLGRPLLRSERVYHKDDNKGNNGILNLELRVNGKIGVEIEDYVVSYLKRLTKEQLRAVLARVNTPE